MSDPLGGLEPALLWERFSELTRIARPSKAEGPARDHVLAWAAARSLAARTDGEGNVVVQVAASTGRETAPVVVLQAHLDIVCERDPDSPFDPREGRIDVRVEGDWVQANGTTLGADNGIGVAAALAVADDDAIQHGPLELVLTVSEEQGLDGAKALDDSLVSGRLLVNLDGTSDGALTIGCAGSDHTLLRMALPAEPVPADTVVRRIELSGAKGGHSGGDIAAGRVNAVKALGRVLAAAYEAAPFGLVSLDGGVSRNAIPRDARALACVPAALEDSFRRAAETELAAVVRQHAGKDDGLVLGISTAEAGTAASPEKTRRALDLVSAIPTGVVAITPGLVDVVETSTSLTTAASESGVLTLGSMTRSSNAAALDSVLATMHALARLGGAEIEARRSYPPWEPKLESALLATANATYARVFGTDPTFTVVHGGLECAVLGQRLPGVEMISIGPEIVGPHAPGEKVRISSTQRFYRLLGALLDELSR
ncbi:MAG TPA: beta-Ala-His dipeptidase [Gaiellaceae bacterium]|nr:beta-Ala-His dipeptidase [Gaiellaceae bacterium]